MLIGVRSRYFWPTTPERVYRCLRQPIQQAPSWSPLSPSYPTGMNEVLGLTRSNPNQLTSKHPGPS